MRSRTDIVARLERLRDRVAEGPGELARGVRRAAAWGDDVPEEARAYADKVRRHAYKVVDEDVEALTAADWSEDQIFELTIAIAMDAGLSRLDRAVRVLEESKG